MKKATIIVLAVLLFWFLLDITGFKAGGFYLVESAFKSEMIDVIFWLIFILIFGLFIFREKIGKYILLAFLAIWGLIQYSMYFGKNISGYNRFFKETHHLIAPSDVFLVNDTYYLFLDLLILLSIVCLITYMFKMRKSDHKSFK